MERQQKYKRLNENVGLTKSLVTIHRSPRTSKAQPTAQEVAENRAKWLARFHQQR
jgi:hypothetical protein